MDRPHAKEDTFQCNPGKLSSGIRKGRGSEEDLKTTGEGHIGTTSNAENRIVLIEGVW